MRKTEKEKQQLGEFLAEFLGKNKSDKSFIITQERIKKNKNIVG